jgi:hypothetical protein
VPFRSVIGPKVGQCLMCGWNIRSSSKLPIKVLEEMWNPTCYKTKSPSNSPSKSPIPPNKTYISDDAKNPDNLWIPLPPYFLVCIYTFHLKCPGTEPPGMWLIMQVGTTCSWVLYHVMSGILRPNKLHSSMKTDGGRMNTISWLLCFNATALVLCVLVGT